MSNKPLYYKDSKKLSDIDNIVTIDFQEMDILILKLLENFSKDDFLIMGCYDGRYIDIFHLDHILISDSGITGFITLQGRQSYEVISKYRLYMYNGLLIKLRNEEQANLTKILFK